VVVVGGGPAGMEAARVSALRGHDVTLYEKSRRLGGLLPLAALIKGTEVEALPAITRYLGRAITRHGVKIELGKEFTAALAEKIGADAVILATGSLPFRPDLPGIAGRNVRTAEELHRRAKLLIDLLGPGLLGSLSRLWLPLGKRVVVVGGSIQGCEAAVFLVKRGRKVTIVEESSQLGAALLSYHRPKLLAWLAENGALALIEVALNEITASGLVVTTKEGEKRSLEADTVLIALPPRPNAELVDELKGRVAEVYQIGDCKAPGLIVDAIGDAARVGHAL
jgi:2,4-dienoyl-CoA reductase (NADPH2)